MNDNLIAELYIQHLITPLETIIKAPDFTKDYSKEEQEHFNQLLLHQYQELEKIMQEK